MSTVRSRPVLDQKVSWWAVGVAEFLVRADFLLILRNTFEEISRLDFQMNVILAPVASEYEQEVETQLVILAFKMVSVIVIHLVYIFSIVQEVFAVQVTESLIPKLFCGLFIRCGYRCGQDMLRIPIESESFLIIVLVHSS